jgi:hypothetical protein
MKARAYVVLACSPYSGSTLLASLLGAHPEIATVSEVSGNQRTSEMAAFRCSCQRLMTECPFWQEIQARMRAVGFDDFRLDDFSLHFGRQIGVLPRIQTGSLRWTLAEDIRDALLSHVPGHERTLRALGRRNQAFANAVLDATEKRVFVDASKEAMRLRYLQRFLDTDLRAVHLVRDVRGVVSSSKRHHGDQVDVRIAARMWSRTNATLMRHLRRMDPGKQMVVRYEDLCRDPEETMASLFAFCGVDPSITQPLAVSYRTQHLLGSRGRLESTAEIRLDESWRSSLSQEEIALIRKASMPLLRWLYPSAIDAAV